LKHSFQPKTDHGKQEMHRKSKIVRQKVSQLCKKVLNIWQR